VVNSGLITNDTPSTNLTNNHFIAYLDERDGKGFLKSSTDSVFQQQVKENHYRLNNALRWTTEKNLYTVKKNA